MPFRATTGRDAGVTYTDEARAAVEQVLAVAISAAIAYAAFYAAAREFGDRYVTLRHKGTIVNRWNGPSH